MDWKLRTRLMLVAIVGAFVPAMATAEPIPRPYLMLVTFGAPSLRDWSEAQRDQINQWPYAGIASTVVGGYDVGRVPSDGDFKRAVELLRPSRVKVWPWVFLNRLIGRGEGQAHDGAATSPYFERINGWDLEDKAGARTDYLALWRLSLRLAKKIGAPGVVLDLETYNDYGTYQLSVLSEHGGWSRDRTIELLRDLGRQMATIAAEEYPSAIIWGFFTGLGGSRTTGFVCEGFLEESLRRRLPAKLVDGGETTVGYYNPSVEVLTVNLRSHISALHPYAVQYRNRIVAGGTIAPYHEPDKLTSWIKEASESGGHTYADVEEFRPHFDALFARCEYVWIYGASAACCVPFDSSNATTTAALHRVLGQVYPRWREGYRVLTLPLKEEHLGITARDGKVDFVRQPVDVSDWTKGDPRTDMNQAEVVVGPESAVTRESSKAVKMTVHVNWREPADSKYPIGWPMIHQNFSLPLDLTRFDQFEFWLRLHTNAPLPSPPLKFGFSNDGKEPFWQNVETSKKDEWVKVAIPLDRIGPREKITRLTFYVAESWYRDGDVVTFYLDGLKFLRQTTPQIADWTVQPFLLDAGTANVAGRYVLRGEATESRCKLRWRVTLRGQNRALAAGTIDVTASSGLIKIPTDNLKPGAYTLGLHLIDGNGKLRDQARTQFAILHGH